MKNKFTDKEQQLNRMKSLMNYGLHTEGKKAQYSSVEYTKLGADGKMYGIVREGTKYFIKSAPNNGKLVKENFDYIGGFRNRKDNEYDNFALAQKQFDLKMMSLKEAVNNDDVLIESWDLNKKEKLVTEATDKMKSEIFRERQIMKNAMKINEKKECNGICCDISDTQKDNIKSDKPKTGNAKDAVEHEEAELPKEMKEGKETLAWHDSNGNPKADTYLDKSHGTEIGSSSPFDDAKGKDITDNGNPNVESSEAKNGVVKESESMHDKDCQNTPKPGVSNVGDTAPFDGEKGKEITEDVDDVDIDDVSVDDTDVDDSSIDGDDTDSDVSLDDPISDDDVLSDDEDDLADDDALDTDVDDSESTDDVYGDDIESRISAVEDLLSKIASKLGVNDEVDGSEYSNDDDLFSDDDELDYDDNDDFGAEEDIDDNLDLDMPMESKRRRNDIQIYETRAFRNAMRNRRMVNEEGMEAFTDNGRVPSGNMNKLDDFGKHPAYQKKVMNLPPKDKKEFDGYYDMNDDSVRNDNPYGEKIGDGAPFDITPEKIQNAIAEAINRLKKKSSRK